MPDISKMLLITYKPLNTLPSPIPRSFKRAGSPVGHLQLSPYPCCSRPPADAPAGGDTQPGWDRSRLCPRSGCCRLSRRGLTAAVFTSRLPSRVTNGDPSFVFLFRLIPLFRKSLCDSLVTVYSGLWSSSSLTRWVLGRFCVFDPHMLFTATCLSQQVGWSRPFSEGGLCEHPHGGPRTISNGQFGMQPSCSGGQEQLTVRTQTLTCGLGSVPENYPKHL